MTRLRLIAFEELDLHARLIAMVDALANSPPGLVLVTGQSGSGKSVTALALAQRLAAPGQPAVLLCEESSLMSQFGPHGPSWDVRTVPAPAVAPRVPAEERSWRNALSAQALPANALVVVETLDAMNCESVLAASTCLTAHMFTC